MAGDVDRIRYPPPPPPSPSPLLIPPQRRPTSRPRPSLRTTPRPQRKRPSSSIVGFSVVKAKNSSLSGSRGRVEFDDVLTDLNGAWNSQEALFECRVPGLYFFAFNGRGKGNNVENATEGEGDTWIVSLMLNGAEVVSIGGRDGDGSSNSILLPLNGGEQVWLQLVLGNLIEAENRSRTGITSFSGYLVGRIGPNDVEEEWPEGNEWKFLQEPRKDQEEEEESYRDWVRKRRRDRNRLNSYNAYEYYPNDREMPYREERPYHGRPHEESPYQGRPYEESPTYVNRRGSSGFLSLMEASQRQRRRRRNRNRNF